MSQILAEAKWATGLLRYCSASGYGYFPPWHETQDEERREDLKARDDVKAARRRSSHVFQPPHYAWTEPTRKIANGIDERDASRGRRSGEKYRRNLPEWRRSAAGARLCQDQGNECYGRSVRKQADAYQADSAS